VEQEAIHQLWQILEDSEHPESNTFQVTITEHVARVAKVSEALRAYPPVLEEKVLGGKTRDLDTLVNLLATADDSTFPLFQPTRALVGKTLVMAELNLWRLLRHICKEAQKGGIDVSAVQETIDDRLFGCVFTLLAEEVLGLIGMDEKLEIKLRTRAVTHLVDAWGNFHQWAPRKYFPLLQATWDARRRVHVSGGTLMGMGEVLRLLQSGCDPEFVDFFSRENLVEDEQLAFQEFLIGVTTEQLSSLEQTMQEEGRTSFSREEAQAALELDPRARGAGHPGVRAFQFFRERALAAAARRMLDLAGPKKTAEEYVMIYFLEQQAD
tara:strand:- start:1542 stop:2513 length:972 start_codon:yes stop_codon:yes gene_type:complete